VKHDLFTGDVAIVILVGVEGQKHAFVFASVANKSILFFKGICAVEGDVVFTLSTYFVALNVAHHNKFGIF
jgi:hypothetical protein